MGQGTMAKNSKLKNRIIEGVIFLFVLVTAGLLVFEVFINLLEVLE